MIAFKGFRSSWLMLARNSLSVRLAASASSFAFLKLGFAALGFRDVDPQAN
jgi:hypothetical protein